MESQLIFQRNMSPQSSELKNKPSVKQAATFCLHTGLLLGLFINPEDGGDMFLQKVGWLSTDYIALYPRRQDSS
jgi:hypothetical protein